MNTERFKQIEDAFLSFFEKSQRALEIKTEDDYQFALDLLEQLMTKAEDRDGEPLLHLIDIVADAIEGYENSLESIQRYDKEVDAMDHHASMLRVLIDQYNLKIEPGAAEGILKLIQENPSMTDEESLLDGVRVDENLP